MLVTIRADASTAIGSGHVMRCLTLADALRRRGATVSFICRRAAGDLVEQIARRGFPVDALPRRSPSTGEPDGAHDDPLGVTWQQDAEDTVAAIAARHGRTDWLVVDHYGIDARWEGRVRPVARRILVIDDLADRPHDCDILLDQNVPTPLQARYDALVAPATRKLLGLRYLLLREEFARERALERQPSDKALVFFGGSDPSQMTARVVDLLFAVRPDLPLVVLVGAVNPLRDAIRVRCSELGHEFHAGVSDVARLISDCYFAICTCGFFAYELLSLRRPALLTAHSGIQWTIAKALEDLGAAVALSPDDLLRAESLRAGIARTLGIPRQAKGFDLVSGSGADEVVSGMTALDNGR